MNQNVKPAFVQVRNLLGSQVDRSRYRAGGGFRNGKIRDRRSAHAGCDGAVQSRGSCGQPIAGRRKEPVMASFDPSGGRRDEPRPASAARVRASAGVGESLALNVSLFCAASESPISERITYRLNAILVLPDSTCLKGLTRYARRWSTHKPRITTGWPP